MSISDTAGARVLAADGGIDVLIIGAGVAGAAAAAAVAQHVPQARCVLVERASWPRAKVCGCCLNPAGVQLLAELGAVESIRNASASIDSVELRAGSARLALEHRGGLAISRSRMDQLLVNHAISRGVTFTPETHASVVKQGAEGWEVQLTTGNQSRLVTPRMVLIADGLGGSALRDLPQMQPVIATRSWIGIGCVLDEAVFSEHVAPGQIAMHTAPGGYAGLVCLRGGTIALAAALAPALIKRAGSPARAIQEILSSCGRSIEMPLDANFKGTPLLTRTRSQISLPGMLIIGDAAGYVEPFTGEGMTWALAGAKRAAALTAQVLQRSLSGEAAATAWETWHAHHIGSRQRTCRTVRALVHTPGLAQILIRSAGIFAPVKSILASKVHGISETYATGTSP